MIHTLLSHITLLPDQIGSVSEIASPDIFGVDEESKKELMKIRNKKNSNEER